MDLTALNLLMGGLDLANSGVNAAASEAEASYVSQQFRFNAQLAGIQSEEAVVQGQEQKQVSQERTAQLSGQQKVAEAAQGVDVNSGTSAITRKQTGEIGGLDYLTLANNSYMKSLGYKIQGVNDEAQANMALEAGKNKASNLLEEGGIEAFSGTMKAISYADNPYATS